MFGLIGVVGRQHPTEIMNDEGYIKWMKNRRVLCPHNTENIGLVVNVKLVLIIELLVLSGDNTLRLDVK